MTLRKTELFLVIVLFVIALPSQGTFQVTKFVKFLDLRRDLLNAHRPRQVNRL